MIEQLVSTVIPVYNRGVLLREAVASVLAQTWRPIEIVIVDDGSTDDTAAHAMALAREHPHVIKVITQANAGPGAARQAGLRVAAGEFVQFLDSDDRLLPDKFALQVAGLRADTQAGISYGKTYTTTDDGERMPQPAQRSGEEHRFLFPALLHGRIWETCTPLYRRSALERIGPWPTKRQMEDWEFDAQAGAAAIALRYETGWLAEYRAHAGPRLAYAWMDDPARLADLVAAHLRILRLAQDARVSGEPLAFFGRALFRLARICGARGARELARQCLLGARTAVLPGSWSAAQMRLYEIASRLCGWQTVGRATLLRDRLGALRQR